MQNTQASPEAPVIRLQHRYDTTIKLISEAEGAWIVIEPSTVGGLSNQSKQGRILQAAGMRGIRIQTTFQDDGEAVRALSCLGGDSLMSNSTTKALWEVSKELDISYTDLLILARLADRQNEISKLCCPSCESLAEDCKVNEKTVRRAIKVLRNEGLITTTPNGRGFNFVFHLTEPKTPSPSGTSLSDQVPQSRPANEVLRSDNDVRQVGQ